MTVTMTVAADPANFQTKLDIRGLTLGVVYTLARVEGTTEVQLRTWTANRTSEQWADVTLPFNQPVSYRLTATGVDVSTGDVSLPYAGTVDVPLWDVNAPSTSWPILRAANQPALGFMRIPVSDYAATFGYRSTVQQVLGSHVPSVATDVVVMKQGDLAFLTADNQQRQTLLNFFKHTSLLHLRAPCVDGLDDLFFRVLNVDESVPAPGRPLLRQWQVRFQQVPQPPTYGLFEWENATTWADVKSWGTWADVKAKGTWLDVRDGGAVVSVMGTKPVDVLGRW